ncbi:subunit 17 of mediator complex protein [Ceratobasidium sp. AG-Ba]|nr:subunit 17 of mediator complex protein [Ceratobasidium sp. AG-Ba]QRW01558.1 subunit 17 of mediator complex protein [Ceratobasidium sp. AG-Ba]
MDGLDSHPVKLSLEPPYRDDNGKSVPNLRDIGNDGTLIFEEKQSPSTALGPQLRRLHDLIISRKREFRTITEARVLADGAGIIDTVSSSGAHLPANVEADVFPEDEGDGTQDVNGEEEQQNVALNPESLMQLRTEMIQRLDEARFSMNTSLDLLNCLLAINSIAGTTITGGVNPTAGLAGFAPTPSAQAPPAPVTLAPSVLGLTATKPSVAVMNTQIGVTTRDSGIRKAAAILRKAALSTAEEIERAGRSGASGASQNRYDTSYWATALRLRQACWALLPAPLPGPPLKGTTRVSKDILFGFALEGSPVAYRRVAFGSVPSATSLKLSTTDDKSQPLLVFPHSQGRRLQVSLKINGKRYSCPVETLPEASPAVSGRSTTQALNNLMRDAQQELIEQEIFSELSSQVRFAGTPVTQLSSNCLELEITQDITLIFERISTEEEDTRDETPITDPSEPDVIICTLIRHMLTILLTRAHRGILLDGIAHSVPVTLPNAGTVIKKQVPILGPVVSLLRYRGMVQRVNFELKKVLAGLGEAGVQATLTMSGVSEPAKGFIESLSRFVDASGDAQVPLGFQRPDQSLALSGEALLRIADRHLIQITFHSPTLLKLQVVQAQITVHDHGQLGDFLRADVTARVVQYIQDIGKNFAVETAKPDTRSPEFSKSWFVDPIAGYCIGRWRDGKGRFQVVLQESGSLHCEASVEYQGKTFSATYGGTKGVKLKNWVYSLMSAPPSLSS